MGIQSLQVDTLESLDLAIAWLRIRSGVGGQGGQQEQQLQRLQQAEEAGPETRAVSGLTHLHLGCNLSITCTLTFITVKNSRIAGNSITCSLPLPANHWLSATGELRA